jgi:hypothetical protein
LRRRPEAFELCRWFSWHDAILTAPIDFALTGHLLQLTNSTTNRRAIFVLACCSRASKWCWLFVFELTRAQAPPLLRAKRNERI